MGRVFLQIKIYKLSGKGYAYFMQKKLIP